MTEHTPEPWETKKSHRPATNIYSSQNYCIAEGIQISNADRIVACVNALAGISDPDSFVEAADEIANYTESFMPVELIEAYRKARGES